MKQYSYGLCSLLQLCVKSPVVTLTIAARQYLSGYHAVDEMRNSVLRYWLPKAP